MHCSSFIYGLNFQMLVDFMTRMVRKGTLRTCAREYAHEEYIPANLSLYRIVLSIAMNGRTDEQLPIPVNCTKMYIAPRMLNRSCSPFLGEQKQTSCQVHRRSRCSVFRVLRDSCAVLHVLPLLPEECSK